MDATGVPLAVSLTGGNRNDVTQLLPLIDKIPKIIPIPARRGRLRQRPVRLYADRAYDHDSYRRHVRKRHITAVIARRINNVGTGHGSGLGIYRYIAEQTLALPHWFRRLRIRWERRDDIHHGFLALATSIICWRRLKQSF